MSRRARSVSGIAFVLAALVFLLWRAERRTPEEAPLEVPAVGAGASARDESALGVLEDPALDARREASPAAPVPLQASRQAESVEGRAISGRVVDDLGAPVPEFTIEARRSGSERGTSWASDLDMVTFNGRRLAEDPAAREEYLVMLGRGREFRQRSFSSPDGTFRIGELEPGQWQVAAETATRRRSAPLVVDTEKAAGDLLLVIPRPAALAGLVIDGTGAPVDQAAVDVLAAGQEDLEWRLEDSELLPRTDASGRFALEDVIAGQVRLRARHAGYSNGEWLEVTVAPGERRTDIRLTLTAGGRIEGALDPSLSSPEERQINLFSFRGRRGWRETKTDAFGRFVIEDVIPQDYVLELRPAGYGQPGFHDEPGIRKTLSVREGETTEVIFGGTRTRISVRGRITAGGQPRAGLVVRAVPKDGEDRGETSTTGRDGRYELTLDGPGRTFFLVQSGDSAARFERSVPDEVSVELDFEVPAGRIAGRVVDTDGKPLGILPVTVVREEADPATFWSRYERVRTSPDGSFEFDLLEPGTYTLRTPDGEWLNTPRPDYEQGRVVRAGLELFEDGSLLGLELRLAPAGRVSGQALDANGSPVGGAWIALKDANGRSMSAFREAQSDATGHFDLPSIAPGTYTVSAKNDGAEGESDPCTVEAERTATIRVVLR